MWAIALYDRLTRTLLLSRDRLGVKPLYVFSDDLLLIVASEVKAILEARDRPFALQKDVLARFLVQSLVEAQPETFFTGIEAFPPASFARIPLSTDQSLRPRPEQFWFHPHEAAGEPDRPVDLDAIRATFLDAVRLRLRSDVPVGVMLSGGLDSSAILVATKAADIDHISAFSVVSKDPQANEEPFIDRIAKATGTRVTKLLLEEDDTSLFRDMSDACWYFDHPLVSLAQAAHRRIIGQARELGTIVLLTGQGADEQLGGYRKFLYFFLFDCWRRGRWPRMAAVLAAAMLNNPAVRQFQWNEAKRYVAWSRRRAQRRLVGPALEGASLLDNRAGPSFRQRELMDLKRFSLPLLLTSEDRMSMSHGAEMRTPFLDFRLVELFGRLAPEQKLKGGWTKAPFRQAMRSLLPAEIVWRKDKRGYTVPEAMWARTTLRAAFSEILESPMEADRMGLVNQGAVKDCYARWLAGDWSVSLRDVFNPLSLEVWLRRFGRHITTA